jgi:ribonuclease G
MQQEVLINWTPQETRVAIVESGSVQELLVERTLERGLTGNVYLGKIVRVLPGMQSAFVDIGLERAAFLHVADLWHPHEASHDGQNHRTPVNTLPIEKQIFEGQSLMVQVIKDPIGSKGARLTSQISIAGRLLVFLPQDDHIGISQKIPLQHREALRSRVLQLNGQESGGFILRTNAEDASDDALREDIAYLRQTWKNIRSAALKQPVGSMLHEDLDLLRRVMRDWIGHDTTSIRIDSKEQCAKLQAFGAEYMPQVLDRLQHYTGERPIFDLYAVDVEIQKALQRRVELKSGGYLVIDQTEALTTVDVNTGGFVGARNFDDTIFKTNLEAAQVLSRQLRLRNLGGIIIVDFIDMARNDHQEAELRKQLKRDRIKTMVGEFSGLGLLELTRKRTRESLVQMLCETCPTCQGRGIVKTARTVVYDILREILREAKQFNPKEFRVIAASSVVDMLAEEESQHLASLSDFIEKPISLRADASLQTEQYDIVLL